jgi:formamidopyrimidine-DNA glycosylase
VIKKMPESPEVETIARNLREGTAGCFALPGLTISGIKLYWPKTLMEPSAEIFEDILPGQVVKDVKRRAKYLVISLSRHTILIHLRMSGDLLTCADDVNPGLKHIRFEMEFLEGGRLLFNDPRKFGRIWVVEDPQAILGKLGPEPLDESFTAEEFYSLLHSKKRMIKSLLLDQNFIAGLGNIYTDESLHHAGIHPLTISKNLNLQTSKRLLESIRQVLKDGIQRNGSSIDWVYRGGEYQNNFRVYGRTGQACNVCGAIIERIVIGQRGTHLCPKCQVLYISGEKD